MKTATWSPSVACALVSAAISRPAVPARRGSARLATFRRSGRIVSRGDHPSGVRVLARRGDGPDVKDGGAPAPPCAATPLRRAGLTRAGRPPWKRGYGGRPGRVWGGKGG